jgi:hypothetical protein
MLGLSAPSDFEQATAFFGEILKVLGAALGAAFLTILTFVAGQVFMKFAEPAFELRKEIGSIAQDLEMYANEDEKIADAQKRLEIFRAHASKLHGIVSMILGYEFWQQLFQLPKKENVLKACGQLFGLSNLQVEDRKKRTINGLYATGLRIRELLAIRPLTDGEKGFLERSVTGPHWPPG